ncbi:MAG: hypothetical protein S4CHLAM123_05680 [Chlamydiales bacterium]|nr:hypothetical protein [Chlamydiales bacterium]
MSNHTEALTVCLSVVSIVSWGTWAALHFGDGDPAGAALVRGIAAS